MISTAFLYCLLRGLPWVSRLVHVVGSLLPGGGVQWELVVARDDHLLFWYANCYVGSTTTITTTARKQKSQRLCQLHLLQTLLALPCSDGAMCQASCWRRLPPRVVHTFHIATLIAFKNAFWEILFLLFIVSTLWSLLHERICHLLEWKTCKKNLNKKQFHEKSCFFPNHPYRNNWLNKRKQTIIFTQVYPG